MERRFIDWATAITRVGVVLIIVFLVQILMGLYRYNTRLVTYYNSRRDLIALWEGKTEGLKVLEQLFTAPNINWAKSLNIL
jgi:hypothetical protein